MLLPLPLLPLLVIIGRCPSTADCGLSHSQTTLTLSELPHEAPGHRNQHQLVQTLHSRIERLGYQMQLTPIVTAQPPS